MPPPTRAHIERFVVQSLGGRAAEEVLLGEPGTGSGGDGVSDLAGATTKLGLIYLGLGLGETLIYRGSENEILRLLALDPRAAAKVEADLQRHCATAKAILEDRRRLIETIADELMVCRFINARRFRELYGANQDGLLKRGPCDQHA
jgi:ATP-dependent Zn protease